MRHIRLPVSPGSRSVAGARQVVFVDEVDVFARADRDAVQNHDRADVEHPEDLKRLFRCDSIISYDCEKANCALLKLEFFLYNCACSLAKYEAHFLKRMTRVVANTHMASCNTVNNQMEVLLCYSQSITAIMPSRRHVSALSRACPSIAPAHRWPLLQDGGFCR